jgi:uncharacterized protein (DUF885 family)
VQLKEAKYRPTYAVLKEGLIDDRGMRVCRAQLWDLNHMFGWQVEFPNLADSQPIDSPEDRAAALRRWASLPGYMRQETENLRTGLAQGYSAPKSVVNCVIKQIDALIVADPTKSPFDAPARRAKDSAFAAALEKTVSQQITPRLREYRSFLATEYLPRARAALAVSSLPDGKACYQAFLRMSTTLSRSPEEIFALGEKTVAQNQIEIAAIGRRLYGTDDYATIIARNTEAPENRFASADELLAFSKEALSRTIEKSRPLFFHLPNQEVIVVPLPSFQQGSGNLWSLRSTTGRFEACEIYPPSGDMEIQNARASALRRFLASARVSPRREQRVHEGTYLRR